MKRFLSRLRYRIALLTCSSFTFSHPPKSAIVLETFRIRSYARAERPSFVIAIFKGSSPHSSIWQNSIMSFDCKCALQKSPFLPLNLEPPPPSSVSAQSVWRLPLSFCSLAPCTSSPILRCASRCSQAMDQRSLPCISGSAPKCTCTPSRDPRSSRTDSDSAQRGPVFVIPSTKIESSGRCFPLIMRQKFANFSTKARRAEQRLQERPRFSSASFLVPGLLYVQSYRQFRVHSRNESRQTTSGQKLAVLISERGTGRGLRPCSDDKQFAARTSRNCGKYGNACACKL